MKNNILKKTLAAIAALSMLCSVSCGDSENNSSDNSSKPSASSSDSSVSEKNETTEATDEPTEEPTEKPTKKPTEATTEMITEEEIEDDYYKEYQKLSAKITSFIVKGEITPEEYADKQWKHMTKLGIWGDDFCEINQASGFGYGLDEISDFRNLNWLSKDFSSLEELTLAYGNLCSSPFPHLPSLKTLNIFDCYGVDEYVYEVLSEMENLTYLYIEVDSELAEWGVDSLDINGISSVKSLTRLSLPSTGLTDISQLSLLVNLQQLNLMGNSISDLTPLASLENLQKLYLTGNTISDITPLASLTNLTHLSIMANDITDITPLLSLKNLKTLELKGFDDDNISDEDIERLREALPDCEIN